MVSQCRSLSSRTLPQPASQQPASPLRMDNVSVSEESGYAAADEGSLSIATSRRWHSYPPTGGDPFIAEKGWLQGKGEKRDGRRQTEMLQNELGKERHYPSAR